MNNYVNILDLIRVGLLHTLRGAIGADAGHFGDHGQREGSATYQYLWMPLAEPRQ